MTGTQIITWFLVIFGGALVILCVLLVVSIIRLNAELRRVEANAETMVNRIQRSIRSVQLIIPLVAFMRTHAKRAVDTVRSMKDSKKEKTNAKK
jgi:hypothetical protein